MKLIVGLGNPGREYAGTRHNVGFDVIDRLAARLGWIGSAGQFDRLAKSRFDGLAMDGLAGGQEKLLLVKPTTYMNLSGRSVQAAMAFYQMTPADLLVIVDDTALPLGRLRMRGNGSSGGHNGLRDIERALGTNQYPRLRVGIDAPRGQIPLRDFVLSSLSADQRKLIEPALDRAVDAALMWMEKGVEPVMNRFNAEDKEKEPET